MRERNDYTGEVKCKRCGKWIEPDQLYWGYCDICLQKVQRDIDRKIKGEENI